MKKNQSGKILINFKINKNDEYILKIKDNGRGLPENFEINKSDSLGLKLVNALIKQLNGDIKFTKGNGTSVTIKFPSRAL